MTVPFSLTRITGARVFPMKNGGGHWPDGFGDGSPYGDGEGKGRGFGYGDRVGGGIGYKSVSLVYHLNSDGDGNGEGTAFTTTI